MRTFYTTLRGVPLTCDLECDPAQAGTEVDPTLPASGSLVRVWVNGVDVYDLLTMSDVASIEQTFNDSLGGF